MEGAAVAGLVRAQMLLAREIAPRDEGLRTLSTTDPVEIRRALLSALRAESA
jgi:hypothetical protein